MSAALAGAHSTYHANHASLTSSSCDGNGESCDVEAIRLPAGRGELELDATYFIATATGGGSRKQQQGESGKQQAKGRRGGR